MRSMRTPGGNTLMLANCRAMRARIALVFALFSLMDIVGIVTLTGLGLKFSAIMLAYAGNSLLLTATGRRFGSDQRRRNLPTETGPRTENFLLGFATQFCIPQKQKVPEAAPARRQSASLEDRRGA